jgi:septal ring factor EnvC (AmiA/AmiB activator)
MTPTTIFLAIVGSSAFSAAVTAWFAKRRTVAEIESMNVATAERVVSMVSGQFDALSIEVKRLTERVRDLEQRLTASDKERSQLIVRVEKLHAHIDTLEALMREHQIEPPPRPRSTEDTRP